MDEFVEDLDDDLDAAEPRIERDEPLPVEDLDDLDPEDDIPHIEGIEEDDGATVPPSLVPSIDAAESAADGPAAASAATAPVPPSDSAPKKLKRWPLPPSLTPKKRGSSRAEVALDLEARPSADGAWRCTTCDAAYESRTGLFAHTRFCVGRVASWSCEWCSCSEIETAHKATGPNGVKTLCSACGQRYRHGAHGMPTQNDKGEWVCSSCDRAFPSMGALGGHRRFCDGGTRRTHAHTTG